MKRVLAGLALAALGAQGPTLAQEQPPVFAAEAALVAVDVSVVDGRGRPVADLLPEDFELSVDGQPRAIASLEFVRLGRRPGAPPPPPPPEVLGYATNEGVARGRLVLLAIDQGSLRAGLIRDVTLAADRLLDRLTPEDRVGLLAFPPPGPSVEPTADHVAVRNALGRVVGTFSARLTHLGLVEALALEDDPLRWQMVLERECPLNLPEREREICVALISEEALAFATEYRRLAEASRRTLQSLFATLAGLDGPKTVVLVSQGLHVESAGALQELARAAAAARVSLFVLRLERHGVDASVARPSATPFEDQMHGAWGLEALAGLARGTTFTVGAGAEGIFERVADEISGYYLLGFEPAPDERDDREHEIQVAVRRRGVSLRSRRSVRIDSRPAAPDPAQALTSTLGSPFAIPDVPFRAAAFALPGSVADTVRVLLAVERVEDAAPGGLVGVAVLDARGRLVSSGQRPLEGPRALLAAEVPAGTYTLRVALVDGRGRRGSLAWSFDARLHGGPEVAIGDLMLVPREQGTPAIIPEAGRDAALSAVVELAARDGRPVEGLAVSFEVADDEEAPALLSVEATLEKASGGRGWFAEAPVGAGVLPPGDYLARAVVTRDGRLLGRATRALLVAGGPTGAEAIGARPIRAAELRGLLPRFDRADSLEPGLLAYVLDRVEARSGASVPPAIARARPHARAGRFDAVAEELREVTAASPETSMLRGLQLLAAGDPRGAEGQFKQAVAQDSELVVAAVHIGACEAALGRDQQAIGAWQTALITEPEIPVLRRLLADALLRVDQAAEAVGVLDEELQARPDASVERRRALALAVSGRRQEALPLLDAALDRDPDDLAALYLSLRLAFDAYAQGGGDDPFSRDPERMARYARAYVAAQGPQQQVVARWLRFLEERK